MKLKKASTSLKLISSKFLYALRGQSPGFTGNYVLCIVVWPTRWESPVFVKEGYSENP